MLLFIPNTSESVHVCYVSEFRAGGLAEASASISSFLHTFYTAVRSKEQRYRELPGKMSTVCCVVSVLWCTLKSWFCE